MRTLRRSIAAVKQVKNILVDRFLGKSFGLNRLDLLLINELSPHYGGYFVELGANDGIT